MQAEVIAIGDELVSGQQLDTNSQWLSLRLGEVGIPVLLHSAVGDSLEANVRLFREALDRAEVVICTGGLGPTADDLTRQALAAATDVELTTDPDSLASIRALFARRKREMPQRNILQAMFPRGSRPIPNEHGTAPGIEMHIPRAGRDPCHFYALPGVPAEMRAMWTDRVVVSLARIVPGPQEIIRHKVVRCFGVGESDLERMLPDLIRRGREPTVGITASHSIISLRVTAKAGTVRECERQMEPTLQSIRDCLGSLIYGYDGDELQDVVVGLLKRRSETVATVEVGAGGTLAPWLSDADPLRETYMGGVVVHRLSRDAGTVDDVNQAVGTESGDQIRLRPCFSVNGNGEEEVAKYARRIRLMMQSDYGLALGPFPDSDAAEIAPGDLVIALASPDGVLVKSQPFTGHPRIVQGRAAKQALNHLRLVLLSRSSRC